MESGVFFLAGLGVVLMSASMLQSVTGFGFGLFAVPSLIWLGLSLPEAIAVSLSSVLVQTLHGTVHLRKEVKWRAVATSTVVRCLFLPVGVFTLLQMTVLTPEQVKQVVGGILLIAVIAQWVLRVEARERLHPGLDLLAFSASGFTSGLCGMGGPPLVLWVMSKPWNGTQTRT